VTRLSVHLLGSFRVMLDGEPATGFVSDKARALLAFLAVEAERPHRREALAGLLWPDNTERAARASLRTALANVRQVVGDRAARPPFLHVGRQTVQFNPEGDAWVDVTAFTGLLREQSTSIANRQTFRQLQEAVELYQGDFLTGFSLSDSAAFEEWALLTREQLRRQALTALQHLVEYCEEEDDSQRGLEYAWRQVEMDPLQEAAQRQLMRLLALNGQWDAALAQGESYRQLLETDLGVAPSEETQETFELLLRGELPSRPPTVIRVLEREPRVVGECPYLGLAPFGEADAPFFFGRESFTEQLIEAVRERPLVAVIVGSSGSGKSSAVFAGLVPRLRSEGDWLMVDLRPGAQPFHALAAALLVFLEPELSEAERLAEIGPLAERLSEGEVSLSELVERALERSAGARRALVLLDQFEELYALCPEPELRRRFLETLLAAVEAREGGPASPLVLALTLRADFMGQALAHRPFADALQEASLMLGPMTRDELWAAIERPAEKQGAGFEAGLVERVLDDVGEEPGNLPLLEFALTLLWERLDHGWMTHAAYEEIGQVEGALARYAEQVFDELDANEREGVRQVLVQLVQPGEGTKDTRRVATRAELGEESWGLVQHLADRRLVVTGREPGTGIETVEMVHEALIQGWGRLRGWMEADRAFRTWQERLRVALRGWETSERDEGALLRGAPLAEAEGWLAERGAELSPAEGVFICTSVALREQRQAERDRRRRRTILALAGGLVVALILALLAGGQWQRAEGEVDARATAQAEAETAEGNALRQASIGLATQALNELQGKFPERAVPLALEALEAYPYTWQAERALGQAVLESRLELILSGHSAMLNQIAWSPDGTRVATTSDDGSAIVWDGKTGERQSTFTGHAPWIVYQPNWSPDGARIATAGYDGRVRVWDSASGEELSTLDVEVNYMSWSPEGERIATASLDGVARIWNVAAAKELYTLTHRAEAPLWHVTWSPSGDQIATSDMAGKVVVRDAGTGAEQITLDGHEDWVNWVEWSPSGDRIVTASDDDTAKVWDAATGETLHMLTGHTYNVWFATWSPFGDRIATMSPDTTVRVWDPATGKPLFVFDPGDQPFPTDYYAVIDWSPSGDRIAISRSDASVTVLDATSGDEILTLTGHTGYVRDLVWSPTADRIVTAGEDGTARVWDVSPRARVLTGHTDFSYAAWSPSGDRLATSSYDGTARIWDPDTGEELLVLTGRARQHEVVWSPSGDRIAARTFEDPPLTIEIQIWDMSASSPTYGQELLAIETEPSLSRISWSPAGDRFVIGAWDGQARIWDVSASSPTFGETLRSFGGHGGEDVLSADWSPDGDRIVTSSYSDYALVWDAETAEILFRLAAEQPQGWMTRAIWSPDGKRIATHSDDTVGGRIWDATTGELLRTFTGHTTDVWSLAWSTESDRLLTAGNDGRAKIWDADTGAELLSYSFKGALGHSEWSPDMAQIALG
jgi:WD40 repeat protein/DNA-binding SARP family transcriptional activator